MIDTLKQVREALHAVNTEFICEAAHHAKKDFHGVAEECPIEKRNISAIAKLDALIAAQEKAEPVAWRIWSPDGINVYQYTEDGDGEPLYTATRQPLTDEQLVECYAAVSEKEWALGGMKDATVFARAIEAAHGIGAKP